MIPESWEKSPGPSIHAVFTDEAGYFPHMAYVLYFLAGLIFANGLPHFIKGIIGERHHTPLKGPSGAMLNVVWGTANLFVAGWLWLYASLMPQALGFALVALFLGILVGGITLAKRFEADLRETRYGR
jgi:hypothetical protein